MAWCAVLWFASILEQAQQLAWQKQFAAAEKLYRQVLQSDPASPAARFGLAQVLLWEGRYREARTMFLSLPGADAAEGAATAAYWQGDFRTAAREFAALPNRDFARRGLAGIRSASEGDARVDFEGIDDNQPYRAWRSSVTASMFSDPLTRWDVTAGGYSINSINRGETRTEPFAIVSNAYVLPSQRLTITSSLGALRFPDSSTHPIGGLTIARKVGANSLSVTADHRELLTNASAIDTHASVTRLAASWTHYKPHDWLAGIETGHNRYFDGNSGDYAQGYFLWPIARGFLAGASAAVRNSRETTFFLDSESSTLTGNSFTYSYRGAYRAYWTPIDFREARAIVAFQTSALKVQVEGGIGSDRARAFGPSSGPSLIPSNIFVFDFRRTFHPWRAEVSWSAPVAASYRLQIDVERSVTVFYAANAVRASLVRHR
ncbi:MAG TPA: tetratricopeptide repeat protein [Thermoanaerobaculia bacterium]|nr:tetratricopeptide repeat protein [Thermoanaerobaculia bacterium]